MDIFQLLFSYDGRIGRLTYFLTSFVVGTVAMLSAVGGLYLAFEDIPDPAQLAPMELINLGLGILFWAIIWLAVFCWIQFALVFKRCRDAFGITTLAKIYLLFSFLAIIPMIGILFVLFNLVFLGLLLFKKGVDAHGFDAAAVFGEVEADIRAANPEAFARANASQQTSMLDPDYDLVSRAAELKQTPQTEAPRKPASKPAASTNTGFGRRTSKPAFGHR